jgi:hypothetical protein
MIRTAERDDVWNAEVAMATKYTYKVVPMADLFEWPVGLMWPSTQNRLASERLAAALNLMDIQGWEYISNFGVFFIFRRETSGQVQATGEIVRERETSDQVQSTDVMVREEQAW